MSSLLDLWARCNRTEEAVLLTIRAGGEIDRVDVAAIATVANTKAPQSIDNNHLTMGIADFVNEHAGVRIVRIDMAFAEISDQQCAGECSEALRRDRNAPRRIELAC